MIIFGLMIFVIISCANDDQQVDRTTKTHPTEKNIPKNIAQEISKDTTIGLNDFSYLKRIKNNEYETIFTTGDGKNNADDFLGEVESVEFTRDNRILVLDSKQNQIKIYDVKGNLIRNFGRAGRGPGEFMVPEAMVLSSNNKIVVINRGNRINIYNYDNGTIEFENMVLLKYVPVDICAINNQFIVRGIKQPDQELEADILHIYSTDTGKHLRSFGKSYKSNNWLVVNQLSDGPIACDEENDSIIMMYEYFPYLYSYNLDGELNWVTKINDFTNFEIEEKYRNSKTPSVILTSINGGSEMGYYLKNVSDQEVLMQTRKSNNRKYTFLTYAMMSDDGRGVFLGDDLPTIYAQKNNKFIIADSPNFPSLKLIELSQK